MPPDSLALLHQSGRPRLLDLFCGAGGCSVGYDRAGFDVVGVDIEPHDDYPFEFHQADAMTFPLEGFDAIHASPPCQAFTAAGVIHGNDHHVDLLTPTRERLIAQGTPWVIENVPGAPMRKDLVLCGSMFNLRSENGRLLRHRWFEFGFPFYALVPPCAITPPPRARNLKTVLPEITPGCEWVLEGEGVPTRKYDGTCCMFDGLMWWARREVKPGKQVPDDFRPEMTDDATGKTVGWVPMAQSAFAKWHAEALWDFEGLPPMPTGTYELCGPKINGNPEGFDSHILINHATAEEVQLPEPSLRSPIEIRRAVIGFGQCGWEGIVWHHPDGRMAKLKARDFPKEARDAA